MIVRVTMVRLSAFMLVLALIEEVLGAIDSPGALI